MRKPVIGLTLGDPTGIGAEIVARVLQDKMLPPEADVLLIGDRRQLAQGEADIGARLDIRVVPDAASADFAAPASRCSTSPTWTRPRSRAGRFRRRRAG